MGNRLEIKGVLALLKDFDRLPADLRAEAVTLQSQQAQTALETIAAAYPRKSGGLQDGLRIVPLSSVERFRSVIKLENTAPYAMFYEFGTKRSRAIPTFVPITVRARRANVTAIADLVRTQGMDVTGDRT